MEQKRNTNEDTEKTPEPRSPCPKSFKELQDYKQILWNLQSSLKNKTSAIKTLQIKQEKLDEFLQQLIKDRVEEKRQNLQESVNIDEVLQEIRKFREETNIVLEQNGKGFEKFILVLLQQQKDLTRLNDDVKHTSDDVKRMSDDIAKMATFTTRAGDKSAATKETKCQDQDQQLVKMEKMEHTLEVHGQLINEIEQKLNQQLKAKEKKNEKEQQKVDFLEQELARVNEQLQLQIKCTEKLKLLVDSHKMHQPQEQIQIQEQLLCTQAQQMNEIKIQLPQQVQYLQNHEHALSHLHQQIQQMNETHAQLDQGRQEKIESLTNQVLQQKAELTDALVKGFEAHLKQVNDRLAVNEEKCSSLQEKAQEKINHELKSLNGTVFETFIAKSEVSNMEKTILDNLDRKMIPLKKDQVTAEVTKEKEKWQHEVYERLRKEMLKLFYALKSKDQQPHDKGLCQKPESRESENARCGKDTAVLSVHSNSVLVENNQPINERGLQNYTEEPKKASGQEMLRSPHTNVAIPAVINNPVVSQRVTQRDSLQNVQEIRIENFSEYRRFGGIQYSNYWYTHPHGYNLRARVTITDRVYLNLGQIASDNDAALSWPVTLHVGFSAKCGWGSGETLRRLCSDSKNFERLMPNQSEWWSVRSFSFEEFEKTGCVINDAVVMMVEVHAQLNMKKS